MDHATADHATAYRSTAVGMFCFGAFAGMSVLNGWIQARSALPLSTFGLILATGAIAALLVNLYLRRSGRRLSGEFGLLLLSFSVWLPVLAQSLPALLLAYSLQGAASRIALAGLYRAITEVQRRGEILDLPTNSTLVLESMAGFGLGFAFLLHSQITHYFDSGIPSALFSLFLGLLGASYLRGKLPDWQGGEARKQKSAPSSRALLFAFAVYCTEVFTMTQATAWSSILAGELSFSSTKLPPLLSGGLLTGVFWLVVGCVRWACGQFPAVPLKRIVVFGCFLSLFAVFGVMSNASRGWPLLVCYASLGAGIACFVPFALQAIAAEKNAGQLADRLALLGPVMSVGVHVITGFFAAQRDYFVLGALLASIFLALLTRRPRSASPSTS